MMGRATRRSSWALIGAVALGACAPASRPYRFSSPLIGGAELPFGDEPDRDDGAPDRAPDRARARPPRPRAHPDAAVARIPAPPGREEDDLALGRPPLPARSGPWQRVGTRDAQDPVQAVLALCRAVQPSCRAALPAPDAWRPPTSPVAMHDLLVFDRVGLDNRERLVALVVARDDRGVLEVLYLAAGVWRRGLVDPARPRLHRDSQGRVVNTFLRHHRARPPAGTRFLTGELLVGVVPASDEGVTEGAPRVATRASSQRR